MRPATAAAAAVVAVVARVGEGVGVEARCQTATAIVVRLIWVGMRDGVDAGSAPPSPVSGPLKLDYRGIPPRLPLKILAIALQAEFRLPP